MEKWGASELRREANGKKTISVACPKQKGRAGLLGQTSDAGVRETEVLTQGLPSTFLAQNLLRRLLVATTVLCIDGSGHRVLVFSERTFSFETFTPQAKLEDGLIQNQNQYHQLAHTSGSLSPLQRLIG